MPISKYADETLLLCSKNPILVKYDKKKTLEEVELLLEGCEGKIFSADTLNGIKLLITTFIGTTVV